MSPGRARRKKQQLRWNETIPPKLAVVDEALRLGGMASPGFDCRRRECEARIVSPLGDWPERQITADERFLQRALCACRDLPGEPMLFAWDLSSL